MDSQIHQKDYVEKDECCKKEDDKRKKNIWDIISELMLYIESNRAKIAITAFLTGFILFVLSVVYNGGNIADTFVFMSALCYVIWIFTSFGNLSTDIGWKRALQFGFIMLLVAYIISPPLTVFKAFLVSVLIFYVLYMCVGGISSAFLIIKNTVNNFWQEENQNTTKLKNTISNISAFIGVFGGLVTAITTIINAIIKIGK